MGVLRRVLVVVQVGGTISSPNEYTILFLIALWYPRFGMRRLHE